MQFQWTHFLALVFAFAFAFSHVYLEQQMCPILQRYLKHYCPKADVFRIKDRFFVRGLAGVWSHQIEMMQPSHQNKLSFYKLWLC